MKFSSAGCGRDQTSSLGAEDAEVASSVDMSSGQRPTNDMIQKAMGWSAGRAGPGPYADGH